jgi:alkyldihydroxyacetonephosphate synthase
MASKGAFRPAWREDVPTPGTFRTIFKYSMHEFTHPPDAWVEMFEAEFGMSEADFTKPVAGGDEPVRLDRPSGLPTRHKRALAAIAGPDNVADDDYSRVKYGSGKSLDEDLALRQGVVGSVPDLVVHPREKAEVVEIVRYCARHKIAISTYGAGSGCVLGIRADRGGIALVMRTHMNCVLSVNEANQTAVVQPGILGPDYEAALNRAPELFGTKRAYTCGHFPQSFELASVGGWINALGSGQASTYYGDAYDIVLSQEYVTPTGIVATLDYPATATGPKVNDIFKGTEGAFGVLVEAKLRIFRYQPKNRRYFSFMFPSWEAAVDAAREIVQGEFGRPAVLRISDPEETERGLKLKGYDQGILNRYLSVRGCKAGKRCLCVGIIEGEKGYARHVAAMSSRVARIHHGTTLTGFAAREWERGRYSDVHIREDLLDFGIVLDTLETGVTWDNLHRVHQGVRELVKSRPGTMCLTHASHFYPQGTNLYFILMLRPRSADEYSELRKAVVGRIVECGGSVSHHHGVGRMFAPWLEKQLGTEQMAVLRALKAHFDPDDIMNPGGTLALDPEGRRR